MEQNDQTNEEIDNSVKNSKRFWKYFWGTIIVLALVFIGLNISASKKLSEMPKQEREAKLESIVKDFQQKFPEFVKITKKLNANSIKEIKKHIDENIDIAYQPLYKQINNFSDFHYSVTGEYTELFTAVFGKIENILQEKLFNPVNFNQLLNDAIKKTNNDSLVILKTELSKMKDEVQDKMNLNNDELEFLFSKILKITQNDMENRFYNIKNNLFKGMGLGIGAGTGAMITKLVSKKIAKVIAKKIATKAAIKGGAKLASAGAGAVAGAESGLLCGPGAWLCSPAGAVVGGIAGWLISDKVIVEIDQYYNEEDFKADLRKLIDKQKDATKKTLSSVYTNSFEKLSKGNIDKFKELKSRKMKDIIIE